MQQNIGPYRIEEQLGAGGMGEVYKAYDDRLERWVAIKRIRSDKNEAEETRERFQREARATAKLNHSSIVHLYDIFQDGDSDCIVMEYVEGVTLDSLIRNGPLEPLRAVNLGHEIASGLAEAHAKGIIHRDLKVENIIVTPEGHAKILDFGLARPFFKDGLDASLTGKGQLVGTSRTMSPEYVGGEEIDHRSDLFSLGVLLYEAVTSHSPFKAHNTLATLKQVMLHRQAPAHLVNANVPEEVSTVIENLLEKDPADRPQSAREVAEEFGRISGRTSSGDIDRPALSSTFTTTPTEIFTPTATSLDLWGSRRWLTMIAVVLAAGIVVTYLVTRWRLGGPEDTHVREDPGESTFKERERIILADFQNHTGEPLLDDSIELAFRLGLEQSRFVVLPESQIRDALLRMKRHPDTVVDRELGIEIGQREDARALVIGAIGRIGETYSVSAEVVDPRSSISTFAHQDSAAGPNDIVTALAAVTKAIRLNLGESLAVIEKNRQPLEKVTTTDLEALKAYSLGVTKIFEGQDDAAIQLLERALEIDPEFAMASAKLATVYIHLGYDDAKILETLNRALRQSDRLTESERLYVKGWAARLDGDQEELIRAWSLMSTLFPQDYAGHFNLGATYHDYLGRFDEAARAFEAAAQLAEPENLSQASIQLGYCLIALERHEEALSSLEGAVGEVRQLALSDLYVATRNYPEAQNLLTELLASSSRTVQIQSRLRLAQLYADQGAFGDAAREARLANELASKEGLERWHLVSGLALAASQRQLAASSDFHRTLASTVETARKVMSMEQSKVDLWPVKVVALIGKLAARNGDIESASKLHALISRLAAETSIAAWRVSDLMLQGEILAAGGETLAASELFKEAVALVDSFQAHESLANNYDVRKLTEEAIAEYEWLVRHRGKGIIECLDLCSLTNVIDWSSAHYHLGLLYEAGGNRKAAAEYYRRLSDQWRQAGDHDIKRDAERRLEGIGLPVTDA